MQAVESDASLGSPGMRASRRCGSRMRAATAIFCLVPRLGFAADLSAPPLSGGCCSRVAIDVGHTLSQPGATSAGGGTPNSNTIVALPRPSQRRWPG